MCSQLIDKVQAIRVRPVSTVAHIAHARVDFEASDQNGLVYAVPKLKVSEAVLTVGVSYLQCMISKEA